MGVEDREHERTRLHVDCVQMHCTVDVNGESFPFSQINDISLSGTGITLPLPLSRDTSIHLSFKTASRDVALRGTVAWSHNQPVSLAEINGHGFRTGVRFDPDQRSHIRVLMSSLQEHVADNELFA